MVTLRFLLLVIVFATFICSPSSATKLLTEVSVNYDAAESFGITDLAAISVVDEQKIKFREIFFKISAILF
ncbi:hypothetical protein L484_008080 [Morus notabilis]|uniref:Uncharacterized protein n=1 Tax=Morus notabilis TaxID=981085 RepID=W9RB57_9ROSA|nr:hypothetical protein L484_008080 [Morus notabilis]